MNHPWRTLRSLPSTDLIWTTDPKLLGGGKAAWYPDVDVIAMSPRLSQVERRCSLAHELGHRERGDRPGERGWFGRRQEQGADLWAARFLLPDMPAIADALAWSPWPSEAAAELWVTEHLLRVRLDHLHPSERAYLRERALLR